MSAKSVNVPVDRRRVNVVGLATAACMTATLDHSSIPGEGQAKSLQADRRKPLKPGHPLQTHSIEVSHANSRADKDNVTRNWDPQ